MFESFSDWPPHSALQTTPDVDNAVFYPTEDFSAQYLRFASDISLQIPPDSPKPSSSSRQSQYPTSETQDEASLWGHAPEINQNLDQAARQLVIHRPIPLRPLGCNYGLDQPPIKDCETPTDVTPALTDSQSDLFDSPFLEDQFPYPSEPLEGGSLHTQAQILLKPQSFSSHFPLEVAREVVSTSRNVQETRVQASGTSQPPNVRVLEGPRPVTHAAPLRFSREVYTTLLQAYGPISGEVNTPPDENRYSFAALERRTSHPTISITEIGGELLEVAVDLAGTISVLHRDNFCRIPGCGYWAKCAGRVPRHRFTHFRDRGFECPNPHRQGTGAPKHLECQLSPGQYVTRLDLFKKHFSAPSCQAYTPSFVDPQSLWHGPGRVNEQYLLPFTKDVHLPFKFKTPGP